MSIKGRLSRILNRVEKAAAAPLTGRAYADAVERFHRECDEWQNAFIRDGTILPLPVHAGCNWEIPRERLVPSACVKARLHRMIGLLDYLPGMNEEERRQADGFCGALWAANQDAIAAGLPADDPAAYPEFQTLWKLCTERYLLPCRTSADDSRGLRG